MLKERLNAAHKIASALRPAETDIDTAIASISRLIATVAESRRDARVGFNLCQESLAQLGQAMIGLTSARSNVVNAHAALAKDRIDAGLRTVAIGDVGDCPPASGTLAVVGGQEREAA